jgi:hypothetical protein
MGLLDFISKSGRTERARERAAKRVVNKYAQSPDRFKAFEALLADGSPDAIFALLKRFGMMYDKSIEDEQEKEWVFDALVERGPGILPQVERYLRAAESISWPLRLLDTVASKDHELKVLEKILAEHEPGYERDPTKKIQLLNHLAGFKDKRVPPLVALYLKDMDEGVRYAAVEALVRQADEAAAVGPLLDQFVDEGEDSLRIRLQIGEGFADLGWKVPDEPAARREAVKKLLPDQFRFAKDGRLEKKTQSQ